MNVGGFWFHASLSEPQPQSEPPEIKNFQQDILWAEMTPLDRWKYCLKMWEISIKIISQDLPGKLIYDMENLIIIV